MENFGKWLKNRFKKDPLNVSPEEIKRDQIKIDRLASIKRDEIEDLKDKIMKLIQKGRRQSRETKINIAVELDVIEKEKIQTEKTHERLMNQKRALNMLKSMVDQKNAEEVSTIATRIFDLDVDRVGEIATQSVVKDSMEQDKLKGLESALVGVFGEEQLSDSISQKLEMWDELESGEIDEDKFYNEIEKSTDKMIVKRKEEM